jgi:hypothetical protein
MDYTNNPANNKLPPDASNFIYLGNLYGEAGGSSKTVAAENEAPAQNNGGGPNNNRPNNGGPGGNNRNLRSISSRILQQDNVEHQRRVVLEANEYYESHWEAIDDAMGILYHYRMA